MFPFLNRHKIVGLFGKGASIYLSGLKFCRTRIYLCPPCCKSSPTCLRTDTVTYRLRSPRQKLTVDAMVDVTDNSWYNYRQNDYLCLSFTQRDLHCRFYNRRVYWRHVDLILDLTLDSDWHRIFKFLTALTVYQGPKPRAKSLCLFAFTLPLLPLFRICVALIL